MFITWRTLTVSIFFLAAHAVLASRYIIFTLLTNFRIDVEQHTAKGRIDITLETADTIYVMELKFNKSVDEALAQIEAKHYADAFKLKGKAVVIVGMNFCVEDEVNTLEWKIRWRDFARWTRNIYGDSASRFFQKGGVISNGKLFINAVLCAVFFIGWGSYCGLWHNEGCM